MLVGLQVFPSPDCYTCLVLGVNGTIYLHLIIFSISIQIYISSVRNEKSCQLMMGDAPKVDG
jgi:hypothetical protein